MIKTSTKKKILSAAVSLLECKGIKAVTQLSVAKAVGISQGQLTYHFPKRTDLVLAMTDLSLDKFAELFLEKSARLAEIPKPEVVYDLVWDVLTNHARIRALLGLMVEADEAAEIRQKLIEREKTARRLIATALSLEEDDPRLTSMHATLLGFGVLSFVRGGGQKELRRDFMATVKTLTSEFKKPGSKKGSKKNA